MKLNHNIKEIDYHADSQKKFINPGEFFFGDSNNQIHTLLGSCISITLWHPVHCIGGMCHFVLPDRKGLSGMQHNRRLDGRYADEAMMLFEKAAAKYGTKLKEYQAKIFGGSNMLMNSTLRQDELIGTKNTEAALQHLYERDIALLVAHVGETGYRRIAFNITNGDVWVKHEALQKIIP